MKKLVRGLIKFYVVYAGFSVFAVVILYASADLKCFIESGESFLMALLLKPETVTDSMAARSVLSFFAIAFEAVPCDTFLEGLFNISFDSNVGADISSLIIELLQSGEAASRLAKALQAYTLFWRDMAVTSCASMVLYAIAHLKSKLVGKDLCVQLGFALASVFWILAAYTFAEVLTYTLELRFSTNQLNALYIVIMTTTVLLEALIHAYGGECAISRLIALLSLKIFFNLIKNAFLIYTYATLLSFIHIQDSVSLVVLPINMLGLAASIGIFLCIFGLEAKITKWAEKKIP